jgi:hypothetical protein
VLANAIRPPTGATIYQQVWPKLSLTGVRNGATIAFCVTDAGDPVAGAAVKAGGKTLRTNAAGRATLAKAPPGRVRANASKAAYAPATATVR